MGYFIYSMIEIINRGYTHWTMSLTGGFILALLYSINSSGGMTLLKSCFTGAICITLAELIVGIFDNLIMHWNVWDYSNMPFHYRGQVCLLYTVLWFFLSMPICLLTGVMKKQFQKVKAGVSKALPAPLQKESR